MLLLLDKAASGAQLQTSEGEGVYPLPRGTLTGAGG